ncbi:MAG: hypothetical protein JW909_02270 [Planctomycetes bacterium]|nr:hypothetical protein [Planctomycetota bacterium]
MQIVSLATVETPARKDPSLQRSVARSLPGESVPSRNYMPPLWRRSDLLALERARLAFHRIAGKKQGSRPLVQFVRVSGPAGGPLDNAPHDSITARAESIVASGDSGIGTGKARLDRIVEWAAFTGLRNLLLGAAWSGVYRISEPFVFTSGAGLASLLGARSAIDGLKSLDPETVPQTLFSTIGIWSRSDGAPGALWADVKTALESLAVSSARLSSAAFFSNSAVSSSGPDVLRVLSTAAALSDGAGLDVQVLRTASGMVMASEVLPSSALGLQGRIRVGDADLFVSPSDNAAAVAAGINSLGEEVSARLAGGCLELSSSFGVPSLGDPDGVLAAMGFFDADGLPAHVLKMAESAEILVGGELLRSWNGRFTLGSGLAVQACAPGVAVLTAVSRSDEILAAVRSFVDDYNGAVAVLNRAVARSEGALPGGTVLQGIESAAVSSLLGPVLGPPDALDEASEVGIDVAPGAARSFSSIALLVAAARPGSSALLSSSTVSVRKVLSSMGVSLEDDYTAAFDGGRFLDAFRADPAGVGMVFAGPDGQDGVAARIARIASCAVRSDTGLLDIAEETAGAIFARRPWLAYADAMRKNVSSLLSLLV